MSIYISTLPIEGAYLEGVNPLTMFRNRNHHREFRIDIPESEKKSF